MYKILLNGLKFHSHLGHYDNEKAIGTDIIIDIVLRVKNQNNFLEDNIDYVVNYQSVYNEIKNLISIKSFALIETLSANIIAMILEKFSLVEEVTITAKKTNIQICGEINSVGVEMSLSRKDFKI